MTFEIYDGGENYGYFNAHQSYPIKYYDQEFNYSFPELQDNGIVLEKEEIENTKITLDISSVYILNELKDDGTAIKLKLIPGKPFK